MTIILNLQFFLKNFSYLRKLSFILLIFSFIHLSSSCGSKDDDDAEDVAAGVQESIAAGINEASISDQVDTILPVIDAQGTELATVNIAKGALPNNSKIKMALLTAEAALTAFLKGKTLTALSGAFNLQAFTSDDSSLNQFNQEIDLTLTIDANATFEKEKMCVFFQEENTKKYYIWKNEDLTIDNNKVSVKTKHLGIYQIFSCEADFSDPEVEPYSTLNTEASLVIKTKSGSNSFTTEGLGEAYFEITLSKKPESDVTITLSLSDSSEGEITSNTILTFTVANWNIAQVITIKGVNDDLSDGEQTYKLIASAASSDSFSGKITEQNIKNSDNDTPGLTLSDLSSETTNEGGGQSSFTAVLSTQPTDDVVISIISDTTAEATVSSSSLTFTNSNWDTVQTITITGQNDDLDDGDKTYKITVSINQESTIDSDFDNLPTTVLNLSNIDNDTAALSISTNSTSTSESGDLVSIKIKLASKPTAGVLVSSASSDTSEGVLNTSELNFTSSNWNTEQTVIAVGVNDVASDGNISYNVTFDPQSTDPKYNALDTASIALTNVDNE